MKITKLQKEAAKFASPSGIRQELECVMHNGKTAIATDAWRLVEITADEAEACKPILANAAQLLKVKIKTEAEIGKNDIIADGITYPLIVSGTLDYPKIEAVWKLADGDYIETTVNGKYLAEIAATLAKLDQFSRVLLRVSKEKNKPLELRAAGSDHTARALLMPIIS